MVLSKLAWSDGLFLKITFLNGPSIIIGWMIVFGLTKTSSLECQICQGMREQGYLLASATLGFLFVTLMNSDHLTFASLSSVFR
jgi:hypothetical protein